jgi:hypothetical protein
MTMKTYTNRAGLILGLAVLAACGADRSASTKSYAVLSDARNDGAPGFYFLPPVAPQPATESENDRGLSPVVEITALDAGAAMLARFEGSAVKESGSHYMVLWSTKEYVPKAGTTYRIRVLLDDEELGFADAQVAKNGKELRALASDEIFPLTGQRTVPIKFRIHVEEPQDPCLGVVCDAPTQCQASVACDPASGACVATAKPQGVACDDGDGCTTGDACDANGVCVAGTPLVCDAPTQCQASVACDPAVGACVADSSPAGTACSDGSACTTGDACDGEGACVAGAGAVCTDIDTCNPAVGCDPGTGCLYDHLNGGFCIATGGVNGFCQVPAGAVLSVCVPSAPGKISR